MLATQKNLVLVTRVKFWLTTGGIYQRSANLIKYLSKNLELTVYFVGAADEGDHQAASGFSTKFNLVWNHRESDVGNDVYLNEFSQLCQSEKFDACLIIRIDCAMFRPCLPQGVPSFIEIDDLESEQDQGKKNAGMEALWGVTFEQELAVFRQFDYLIVIHQEHKIKLSDYFSPENIIVSGHSVSFERMPVNDTVKNIGFVGSFWEANIDAMYWFMYEVWPRYQHSGLHMHIYGEVARGLHKFPYSNVTVHSYIDNINDIYSSCDIFVNPVRYGSGLKIKAVETMANGLPLIASSEGVRGLAQLENQAFLVANTKREYIAHINQLVESKEVREALGKAAYEYAYSSFTDEQSYLELLQKINNCSAHIECKRQP